MVNMWRNEQGFLLYLDLRFPKCWRIFQKWWRAPHGPITHSSRSPSTITSQTQIYEWSLTFAPAILTWSTDDAWFNFYPFIELIPDWKFDLFVEKRVFCYRSSPRPFWDHRAHALSRYKSNCGRLLQHHQFEKPPTRRGFQKVYLILTSGFPLV